MLQKTCLCITFIFTIAHAYYISPPVSSENVMHCGSAPAEAKQMGCHFDLFSYAYYAPQCWNKAHHDDFLKVHGPEINWTLPDYTPVTTSEALEGIHIDLRPISGQYHDLHCTYEWLRLIRALAEKRPLDWKLSKFAHSSHCSKRLLDKDKSGRNETATTPTNILFGSCGLTADQMHEYGTKSDSGLV
jgi:hypothetical protein